MEPVFSRLKIKLSCMAIGIALGTSPVIATAANFDGHHLYHWIHQHKSTSKSFNRVASFPVFKNTDIGDETVAEIVAASKDGNTLIYTDSETENLGFVDITDPKNPAALGVVGLSGEPTSVAVTDQYALVAVNTSVDFVTTSGELIIVDIASQTIVATHALDGQPDSIATSKDGRYAAIAIENERDEDLGDGEPPQAPAGFLTIVDTVGNPLDWTTRQVDFSGVSDLFPEDAEPEYVDINARNIAVVTLQENNHIVLVALKNGRIIRDFSAGVVDLDQIDTEEEDPALITLDSGENDVAREPDGVNWLNKYLFATANEGDLFGGSRGFSIFSKHGKLKYDSGNSMDHLAVRLGHYPDGRSGNKGNEPENVESGRFGYENLLFVGSERANIIAIYNVNKPGKPQLKQVLPAGVGPEGLLAIPHRNLFIAASEVDDRGDKSRSVLNIYKREQGRPDYPTVKSANRDDGTPIPWGALSGLAIDKKHSRKAYTIHDSFYQQSRIYTMNLRHKPALIKDEIILQDSMGKLSAVEPSLVNGDGTVNLDQEGITSRKGGGFWIASEGRGTIGDSDRPFEFLNLLVKVTANGVIEDVVVLPDSTNARQVRFGFEGVASVGSGHHETLFVAFQREWMDDPDDHVRIGRYDVASGEWLFYYYPLEAPQSANGGWVGLSEIAHLGGDDFAVIERDNQGGADAVIKRIYKFSVADLTPLADPDTGSTPAFPVVEKVLVRDLVPDIAAKGGQILEKIEGLAVNRRGHAFVVNDNDGVDDNNGETQLLRLRGLFK